MRDKVVSVITGVVGIGLGIGIALGSQPAKIIFGVLSLICLACVAVPWIISELPPPWRRRQ